MKMIVFMPVCSAVVSNGGICQSGFRHGTRILQHLADRRLRLQAVTCIALQTCVPGLSAQYGPVPRPVTLQSQAMQVADTL